MREVLKASSLSQRAGSAGHHGGQPGGIDLEPGQHPRLFPGQAQPDRLRTGSAQLRRWSGTEPAYASSLAAAVSGGACRSRWDLTVTGSGHGIASSGSSNAIETSSDGLCT